MQVRLVEGSNTECASTIGTVPSVPYHPRPSQPMAVVQPPPEQQDTKQSFVQQQVPSTKVYPEERGMGAWAPWLLVGMMLAATAAVIIIFA